MSLFEHLKEECVQVGTEAKDKDAILKDIAKLAKQSSLLDNISEEHLYKSLKEREEIGSTGFDGGVAIPHCRLPEVNDFVVGLISVPSGIDFDSLDKKPANLIFFIIAPEADRQTHIRLLAAISRTLSLRGVKDELLKKLNAIELRESFLRHASDTTVAKQKNEEKCLFHIAIQDPDKFDIILETLSSLSASMTVIEGKDAGNYLNALPLFSSFWNDKDKGFHRLIVGTLNKKLVNELIRNLELQIEDFEANSGVSVCIQDVLLTYGSLA